MGGFSQEEPPRRTGPSSDDEDCARGSREIWGALKGRHGEACRNSRILRRVPPIAVIDFETTGLSPAMGDRATEVAIVLMEDGKVVDRFQSLMNAGVRISAF